MIPRKALLALLIVGLALAGCGRRAQLDKPTAQSKTYPPNTAQLTRQQAANRARAEGAKVGDPRAPQSVDEVRNQPLDPPPPDTPTSPTPQ